MSRFDRPPEIDYLAKDFASFRQLMLDQIALLMPDWQERHPADLGNVLVEILAHAADYLSYAQDGIATEAYLGTARLRRSVRRHVRLLDYNLHNGCNARTWVHIKLQGDDDRCLPKGALLIAGANLPDRAWLPSGEVAAMLAQDASVQVFTTLHDVDLSASQPEICFYVENRADAVLPRGAVSAHLVDGENLKVGDVLIFEQRLDPDSGLSAGVDPSHCHAIRVMKVERTPLAGPSSRASAGAATGSPPAPVTITWNQADALPFDLPVGTYRSVAQGSGAAARPISVALRNIVLVDHGAWVDPETLPPVSPRERYRPYLTYSHVTYATGYDHAQGCSQPASAAMAQRPYDAQAVVNLTEQRTLLLPEAKNHPPLFRSAQSQTESDEFASIHRWVQRRDLLSSDASARTFVVETEDDGRAYLRFGYGGMGKGPSSNNTLIASYRIGNGSQGNVGRHAIAHLVTDDQGLGKAIKEVCNPLPVTSGVDAESIEAARLAAPYAFQAHRSCVSPDDYAALALQLPGGAVRQARARIELTGNWQTVFVYVQRQGDQPVDAAFREQALAWLRRRAMSGYEVAIRPPRTVGLDLHLRVRVAPHRFRNAVRRALQQALGSGLQEDGRPGFFHPDNLAFGQSIYRSQVIRAVMAVDGVARVEILRFSRLDDTRTPDPVPIGELEIARLDADPVPIGELEIARLDADPSHPERGTVRIDVEGGA